MTDEETASDFLDVIQSAASDGDARFVITLRADFLDRPLLYSEFGRLLRDNMVVLTSPSPADLANSILKPAEQVGVSFDPGVTERIVAEVKDRPGALPLMQYALAQLFEARSSDFIDLDDYTEAGGVVGSLAARAETIFNGLSELDRRKAKQVLLRLVTVLDDAAPTRRRVRLAALADLDADAVVDAFGRNRMLVFDTDHDTRSPTVEVAHEALLSHWPRLSGWIESTREDLTMARRLHEAMAEWRDQDEDENYLLTGSRLDQHRAWTKATGLRLSPEQTRFLTLSESRDQRQRKRRVRARPTDHWRVCGRRPHSNIIWARGTS